MKNRKGGTNNNSTEQDASESKSPPSTMADRGTGAGNQSFVLTLSVFINLVLGFFVVFRMAGVSDRLAVHSKYGLSGLSPLSAGPVRPLAPAGAPAFSDGAQQAALAPYASGGKVQVKADDDKLQKQRSQRPVWTQISDIAAANDHVAPYQANHFLGGHPFDPGMVVGAPNINKKFFFFHRPNQHAVHYYRQILVANGWTEARTFEELEVSPVSFVFLTRAPSEWKTKYSFFAEGRHIINHSPGDRVIFNKEPFAMHLRQWGSINNCDYTHLHPQTFRLHDAAECEEVFKIEADHPERRAERDWFRKILEGRFGVGVEMTSLAQLRQHWTKGTDTTVPMTDPEMRAQICKRMSKKVLRKGGLLLQRAVRPFLTQGKKFDIRTHLLIANMDPYYVFYNTRSAYLRRSTTNYDPFSTSRSSQVTNSHYQMHEEEFKPENHLWGLHTTFRDYMLAQGYTEEQFHEVFHVQMKKLQEGMFRSFQHHLNRKNGYWLLLGVDIIVDENLHLSILEANTNPALRYDVELVGTEALERFFGMSHEMLNLVYEVHHKTNNPAAKYDPLKWETARDFELLYTDDPRLPIPWSYGNENCYVNKDIKPKNPPKPFP